MPPSKSSKASEPMKQAKLSFASKRTGSAAGKAAKPAVAKRPSRTPSVPASTPAVIELSDNSSSESTSEVKPPRAGPAPKKRRLGLRAKRVGAEDESLSLPGKERDLAESVPEKEPLNVSDERWRKLFGKARAQMGDIDPVHAKGQNMVDYILRVFDLSDEYGPCIGVPRLLRWERAHALGLNPPQEIKEILLSKEGKEETRYSQSVFYGEV